MLGCRFNSVTDLGTPEEAASRILDQYLNKEFMSTRLGIKREGQVLSAGSRQGPGGRTYYDIDVSRVPDWGSGWRSVSPPAGGGISSPCLTFATCGMRDALGWFLVPPCQSSPCAGVSLPTVSVC